ncbi:MAG: bifunctional phosphoglucose/phosphomannose isomerase [Anaerolineales bacterium]
MNLNNLTRFQQIDTQNMLAEIDGLPDQLETAWQLSQRQPLPEWKGITRVLIAGMGGSAIGADLLAAYAAPLCPVPIIVHRDYGLPAWARGPETLVIASSHSGNTEETLSAFSHATENGCTRMVITTGGKLGEMAEASHSALWTFAHSGQPRAAVGYSFGLLLGALARLGLVPDPANGVASAAATMREQQTHLKRDVPVVHNPARRQAGQLVDRWIAVIGSEILAPVARRWKGQVSELAKAWAQFEALPEADHNTLAGTANPENLFAGAITLFLMAPSYHPRNTLRSKLTRRMFMLEGIATDFFMAPGETRLAQQWTALHFGDYMAYYLAIAYGVDPTPVDTIERFKTEMRTAG